MFTGTYDELTKLAEARGMTLKEAFRAAGIADSTWVRFKNRRFNLRSETLRKIVAVLDGDAQAA